MERNLEPVDLMVVVGVFATLLGGSLLFMATSGPFQTQTPEAASVNRSPDIMDAMQWIQPALGRPAARGLLQRGLPLLAAVRRAAERAAADPLAVEQRIFRACRGAGRDWRLSHRRRHLSFAVR